MLQRIPSNDGDLLLLDFETPQITPSSTPVDDPIAADVKSRKGVDLDHSVFEKTESSQDLLAEKQTILPSPCSTIRSHSYAPCIVEDDPAGFDNSSILSSDSSESSASTTALDPRPQVDYFSHNWTAFELIKSQKSLQQITMMTETNMATEPTERVRLTNCLWRNWWRFLQGLPSFPDHRGEWEEDFDPLFLYGPTVLEQSRSEPPLRKSFSEFGRKKSILKMSNSRQRLASERLGVKGKGCGTGSDSDSSSQARRVEFNI